MITLIPAVFERDWARLYYYRNDPATRAASLDTDIVPLDKHLLWVTATIEKASVRLFMARDPMRGLPWVGTARLDKLAANYAEVSLTVAPSARGQGYAGQILAVLKEEAVRQFPKTASLKARVKTDNYASLQAFAEAGFVVRDVADGVATLTFACV